MSSRPLPAIQEYNNLDNSGPRIILYTPRSYEEGIVDLFHGKAVSKKKQICCLHLMTSRTVKQPASEAWSSKRPHRSLKGYKVTLILEAKHRLPVECAILGREVVGKFDKIAAKWYLKNR